jgi:hypothetical protein
VRGEHGARRPPGERRRAGEQLVRRDAERVHVGRRPDVVVGAHLLGRHVRRRAERGAHRGERAGARGVALCRRGRVARRGQRLGHAEVGHHRRPAGEQDVVGLDVAVHDAAPVRHGEGARHVAQDAHGLGHGQRPALERARSEAPVDERHEEVRQPVELPGAEHGDDVRVLQRGGDEDLAPEPVHRHAGGELRPEHLDHHPPPSCRSWATHTRAMPPPRARARGRRLRRDGAGPDPRAASRTTGAWRG